MNRSEDRARKTREPPDNANDSTGNSNIQNPGIHASAGLLADSRLSPWQPVCLRLLIGRLQSGSRDLGNSAVYLGIGLFSTSAALAILIHLPQAPYNVQELFGDHTLIISLPLFSAFLIWSACIPNLAARITIICPLLHLAQPIILVLMAGPAWVLLSLSVSTESLVDIMGEQTGHWAMFLSFLGLAAPVLLSLYIWNLLLEGSAWLNRRFGIGHMLGALSLGLPMLWVSKYIVIDQTTTTRLIDLSAQGPFWLIGGALAAAISLLTLNGVLIAWSWLWNVAYRIAVAAMSPALLAASWWLLNQGLHNEAVTFLLGPDLSYQGGDWGLFLRWALVYSGGVLLIAFAHMIPFRLRGSPQQQRQALDKGHLHRVQFTAQD